MVAPSSTSASSSSSSSSTLTCQQVLSPPAKQIGEGPNKLVYVDVNQPAWQCIFSTFGDYLAVCYGAPDPCVRIWKKKNRPQPQTNDTSTSTDNHHKNDTDDDEWQVHTVLTGMHHRTIRSIAFAPSPTVTTPLMLASASFDGTIAIWQQQQQQSVDDSDKWLCTAQLEGHENEVKCVAWNATGSLLASCGRDKTVWVWECYSEGSVGAATADYDFECLAVLNGHQQDVKHVLFAPSHGEWGDGDEIVLSASYDETIKCWAEDGGDWYCAATISNVHTATIWSLAVTPSGTRLVSGSADGSLAIYKAYSETEKEKLLQAATTDEEKQQLSSTSSGNGLWKCVGTLPKAHKGLTIYSIGCAPAKVGHGRMVSAGADNCIHIYRETETSTSDKPIFDLETTAIGRHTSDVNSVCWHPLDGSIVASACDDGTVRVWKYHV